MLKSHGSTVLGSSVASLASRLQTECGGRRIVMKLGRKCSLGFAIGLAALMARADSLELKNGSLIKGRYIGGTESVIQLQVGSSVQNYNVADIVSITLLPTEQQVTRPRRQKVRFRVGP